MYSIYNLILILTYIISIEHQSLSVDEQVQNEKIVLMPWMGVLIYKADNHSIEEVTNIVIIEHRIAIGNAKDIAAVELDSLKKFSKAMFYSQGAPWFCGFVGYLLHPEYKQGFLNTIAIVYLESVSDPYLWKPITLMGNRKEISKWSNVFNIGYIDRRMILEQEILAMDYVSRTTCEEFYVKEEINFDFLWPTNAVCYKVLNTRRTCVNSAGMALASNFSNEWVLMGLSTHGPGCSLPARYINILPYVTWIRHNIKVTKPARRYAYRDAIYNVFGYKSFIDMFFKHIEDKSIVLKPELANITETLFGCYYDDDKKTLMYKENDVFVTQNPIAIGVYALLFFDKNFESRTCVQLYTNCKARSDAKLYFYARAHGSESEVYAKRVPFRPRDIATNNTFTVISDSAFIREIDTHHLEFKFEFSERAMINVTFYGKYNGT